MLFENVATELITQVFLSCNTISDVLALSSTCRRFRGIYSSSQKLTILQHAADFQYGPLEDVVQLLTHNASQPAHIIRSVPFSLTLLKQVIRTGRIAEKWCDIYPFKKWKYNFVDRRLLTSKECYYFRRALYRLWLYTRAFHTPTHTRERRMVPTVRSERAELLHNWSTVELAEIADVHGVLREVVHHDVCPSNGTIAGKFKKRFPEHDAGQLLFNIHLNYSTPPFTPFPLSSQYHNTAAMTTRYFSSKYMATPYHEPGCEGWGDDIGHYYVVEDMLKLDPEQILWLKENAPLKGQVESYVKGLGDWFDNNGETWVQTLEWVLEQRGEEVEEVMGAIADGDLGVAAVEGH
ncbi:hypothetical protein M501DRAFT_969837 [Patellaria atrata CBS 101060]|uniref:F-box domain-containing protein n=1 Tax=Patellaria atrata CBS 101060 TaxID=1346257 RepID=A0A9P4SGZ4_9PEZI|nr:hypothetical protein M501DRAFT_969837 [Patellaria atrata CBS 101060]